MGCAGETGSYYVLCNMCVKITFSFAISVRIKTHLYYPSKSIICCMFKHTYKTVIIKVIIVPEIKCFRFIILTLVSYYHPHFYFFFTVSYFLFFHNSSYSITSNIFVNIVLMINVIYMICTLKIEFFVQNKHKKKIIFSSIM